MLFNAEKRWEKVENRKTGEFNLDRSVATLLISQIDCTKRFV